MVRTNPNENPDRSITEQDQRPPAATHAEVAQRLHADSIALVRACREATIAYHQAIAEREDYHLHLILTGGMPLVRRKVVSDRELILAEKLVTELCDARRRLRKLALEAEIVAFQAPHLGLDFSNVGVGPR